MCINGFCQTFGRVQFVILRQLARDYRPEKLHEAAREVARSALV